MSNLVERYFFTISPDFFFFFFIFAFFTYYDFFSFSLTWEKKLQATFSLKLLNRFTPKNHASFLGGLYKSCIKLAKFQILDCCQFFLFPLRMDHMGEKTTSCLRVHNRFAPKNPCILPRRVSRKIV